jgi:hypothetical protein
MEKLIILGTSEVAEIVGVSVPLLSKYAQRGRYGITASMRPGRTGRGKERLFGVEDVYGIALVHLLFESGLRSEVIQWVVNQICFKKLGSKANDAARRIMEEDKDLIVVLRQPRTGANRPESGDAKLPEQETELYSVKDVAKIAIPQTGSILIIRVGEILKELRTKLGGM